MYHYIYKITNKIDGKFYIGKRSSKIPNDDYYGSGTHIKRAIQKYGKENFIKEIIEYNQSAEINSIREKEIIGNLFLENNCYNIKPGGSGGGIPGWVPSEKYKEKMSEITTGPKNGFYGKKHSEETKKKICEKMIEKHKSQESYGQEYKEKQRAISLGRVFSLEHRIKQSDSAKKQPKKAWITEIETGIVKRIPLSEIDFFINNGYKRGRK